MIWCRSGFFLARSNTSSVVTVDRPAWLLKLSRSVATFSVLQLAPFPDTKAGMAIVVYRLVSRLALWVRRWTVVWHFGYDVKTPHQLFGQLRTTRQPSGATFNWLANGATLSETKQRFPTSRSSSLVVSAMSIFFCWNNVTSVVRWKIAYHWTCLDASWGSGMLHHTAGYEANDRRTSLTIR